MGNAGVHKANIEGVLACYKILDFDAIDPDTVAATFHNDPEKVIEWFDAAECEGFIRQVRGSMYELTDEGERALESVLYRSSGAAAVS